MSKRKLNSSNLYSNSSPSPTPLCDIPYSNASPSGGNDRKCKNSKKADYWTDENSIGINLGSWLCMETWIFDTPYFKPCYSFNQDQTDRGTCNDCNVKGVTQNYQRGELGTIREYNQVASKKHNPGQGTQEWSIFKYDIPPTNRVEPDALNSSNDGADGADGAIKLMQMFWSTFLTTNNNNIQYKDIFGESPNGNVKEGYNLFSIIEDQEVIGRFNLFRIPIGYWAFSHWKKPNERSYVYNANPQTSEPDIWYNNEGFLSGEKASKYYLEKFMEYAKKNNAKVLIDLHACAGVSSPDQDFAGWNTGAPDSNPGKGAYTGGTFFPEGIKDGDGKFILPINDDDYRHTDNVNWVYPGPLPKDTLSSTNPIKYSGYKNWMEYNQEIIGRICDWIKKKQYEDIVYGITCANEPSADAGNSGKQLYYAPQKNIYLPSTAHNPNSPLCNTNDDISYKIGREYFNNIAKYHKNCYSIINTKLRDTNIKFIVSLIANSWYGNGGNVQPLYDYLNSVQNSKLEIIFDNHRYLNWGFIPDFNKDYIKDNVQSIYSGQQGNVSNTLYTDGTWTKYNNTGNHNINNNNDSGRPYKTIIGEWSIATVNNDENSANYEPLNENYMKNIKYYKSYPKTSITETIKMKLSLLYLFQQQINSWHNTDSGYNNECIIASCLWMLRTGYGLIYKNETISYATRNGVRLGYNNSAFKYKDTGNFNTDFAPGGKKQRWQNWDFIWNYTELCRLLNTEEDNMWSKTGTPNHRTIVPSPGGQPSPYAPPPSPYAPPPQGPHGHPPGNAPSPQGQHGHPPGHAPPSSIISKTHNNYIFTFIVIGFICITLLSIFFFRNKKIILNSSLITLVITIILLILSIIFPLKYTTTSDNSHSQGSHGYSPGNSPSPQGPHRHPPGHAPSGYAPPPGGSSAGPPAGPININAKTPEQNKIEKLSITDSSIKTKYNGCNMGGLFIMENWFFGVNEPYTAWGSDSGSQLYVIWKVRYGNDITDDKYKLKYVPHWWDYNQCGANSPNKNVQHFMYDHEKNWATESMFKILANQGINAVRIPVGYWLFHTNSGNKCVFENTHIENPLSPDHYYEIVDGFYAASSDSNHSNGVGKLNHIISLCIKYNFKVIIDLHASPGVGATSQQFAGVNAFLPTGSSVSMYNGNSGFWAHIYQYYLNKQINEEYTGKSKPLNSKANPLTFSQSYPYNMNKDKPPGGGDFSSYTWPTDNYKSTHNKSLNWGHYTMNTIIPNIKTYIKSVNSQYPGTIIGFEPWNEADQFNCPIYGIYAYLKLLGDINFFDGNDDDMKAVRPIINIIGGMTQQELKMAPTSKSMYQNFGLQTPTIEPNIAIGGVNKVFNKEIENLAQPKAFTEGDYMTLDTLQKLLKVPKITFDDHTYIDWTSAGHETSIVKTLDYMCNSPSGKSKPDKDIKSGCIYYGWNDPGKTEPEGTPPHNEQAGPCTECGGGCVLKISSEGSIMEDSKISSEGSIMEDSKMIQVPFDVIHGEWSIAVNDNNTLASGQEEIKNGYGPQSIDDLKALYNNMMIQNTISKVTGSFYWNFRAGCTFTWGNDYINGATNEAAAWIGVNYPISIGDPLGPSCNGSWSLLQLIQMGVGNNISYYIKDNTKPGNLDYCDPKFGGSSKQTSDFKFSYEEPTDTSTFFKDGYKVWDADDYWKVPTTTVIPNTTNSPNCQFWGSKDIPNNNINIDCLQYANMPTQVPHSLYSTFEQQSTTCGQDPGPKPPGPKPPGSPPGSPIGNECYINGQECNQNKGTHCAVEGHDQWKCFNMNCCT